MKKIYIAGPFFNQEQRSAINTMISCVRNANPDAELFIPMEHDIPNGWELSNREWGRAVYKMDISAIEQCDKVVAMYNGMDSDSGTAFEIGYAKALGKPIEIVVPDGTGIVSLMIINAATVVYGDLPNLEQK